MHIDFILKEFEEHKNETAIVWKDKTYTYNSLLENYFHRKQKLTDEYKVLNGSVVALEGDFTPNTIALLLALIENNNIIVPLNYSFNLGKDELINISQPEIIIKVNEDDEINIETTDLKPDNELIKILRERNNPGLILFSSGTSGKSKAAVHDFTKLLNKKLPITVCVKKLYAFETGKPSGARRKSSVTQFGKTCTALIAIRPPME